MMKTSIGFWSSEQNIRVFPCQNDAYEVCIYGNNCKNNVSQRKILPTGAISKVGKKRMTLIVNVGSSIFTTNFYQY